MQDADLRQTNLENADMRGGQFMGAQASTTPMCETQLHRWCWRRRVLNASMANAVLSFADLTEANLEGVNFRGADLTDANLIGANLTNADLTGAILEGARIDIPPDAAAPVKG